MAWQNPQQLENRNQSRLNDAQAQLSEVSTEIGRLVNTKGYRYARIIAQEIKKEYECKPPLKGEDKTKWESYCVVTWAIDKLFASLEKHAAFSPQTLTERLKINDSPRRKQSRRRRR